MKSPELAHTLSLVICRFLAEYPYQQIKNYSYHNNNNDNDVNNNDDVDDNDINSNNTFIIMTMRIKSERNCMTISLI